MSSTRRDGPRLTCREVAVRLENDPAVFGAPFVEIQVDGPEGNTVCLTPDEAHWLLDTALPAVLHVAGSEDA